jgi:hypothetical protein
MWLRMPLVETSFLGKTLKSARFASRRCQSLKQAQSAILDVKVFILFVTFAGRYPLAL